MEIQEVTLNIPLQYKAVQYCEGHFDELREWVEKESLGILQVMFTRSTTPGKPFVYIYDTQRDRCVPVGIATYYDLAWGISDLSCSS